MREREVNRPREKLSDSEVKLCQYLTTQVLRLRMFENRVLRRICGPKRDEGLEKAK